MAIIQKRGKRRVTGGRYASVPKKAANAGSEPTLTLVGKDRPAVKRTRGGHKKMIMHMVAKANIWDQKAKKFVQADITSVVENPANRNFVRRNILTKGAIIETSLGKARVTSRPGQEKSVNAILL